jgi:hypothetical protein
MLPQKMNQNEPEKNNSILGILCRLRYF